MGKIAKVLLALICFNVVVGDGDAGLFFFPGQSVTGAEHAPTIVSTHTTIEITVDRGSHECPPLSGHHGSECQNCHLGHCSFILGLGTVALAPLQNSLRIAMADSRYMPDDRVGGLDRPPRI